MTEEIQELKKLRATYGIPKREIAALLGVPENSVHRWEKGVCTPNPTHRRKIALIIKLFNEDLENEQRKLLAKELGIT